MKVLFLTLKTFSATGGIEKFNRSFAAALYQNHKNHNWNIQVVSAYDHQCDKRYIDSAYFKGFNRNKTKFFLYALQQMSMYDIVVFGHINLSSLLLAGKVRHPKKSLFMVAHGREVWEPLSWIQKKALSHCDKILGVSRFTNSVLQERWKVEPSKTILFPNTLDPFFGDEPSVELITNLRNKYDLSETQPVLITVARLSSTEKNKGYDQVLEALPKVVQRYPDLKYLLCGKADQDEQKRLELKISQLNLQKVVILTGFIEEYELNAHYCLAQTFVMPSSKEGFGIVFIESAWWGLSVIAGNKDGSVDALLDGKLGTMVDQSDVEAIGNAITKSFQDKHTIIEKKYKRDIVSKHFGFSTFMLHQKNVLAHPSS